MTCRDTEASVEVLELGRDVMQRSRLSSSVVVKSITCFCFIEIDIDI